MMVWDEDHVRSGCRVGLFGSPLPADRLRAIANRWQRVRTVGVQMVAGGVIQHARPQSYIIPATLRDGRSAWYACGTVDQILDLLRLKDREEAQ